MSIKLIFDSVSGAFWSDNLDDKIQTNAVVATAPENVAFWRLSLDLKTKKVVVKYDGMTDAEAEVQNTLDIKAEAEAAAKVAADRQAALPK